MREDRQSRVWPYIGLLLCLFALSVTAPRAWQRAAQRHRLDDEQQRSLAAGQLAGAEGQYADPTQAEEASSEPPTAEAQGVPSNPPQVSVRVSNSSDRLAMREPRSVEHVAQTGPLFTPQNQSTLLTELEPDLPTETEPAEVTEEPVTAPDVEVQAEESATAEMSDLEPDDEEVTSVDDRESEADEPEVAESLAIDGESELEEALSENMADEEAESEDETEALSWAVPELLLEQIASLEEIPSAAGWAEQTRLLIEQLSDLPLSESDTRTQLLTDLKKTQDQIEQMSAIEQEWETKARLLRVQYALSRRLAIWRAIHELSVPQEEAEANGQETNPSLQWRELELCQLLEQLEEFEAGRLPHLAKSISEQRHSLLYSSSETEQTIGMRIEQHYRNANVRVAISEDLMNRFLPKPQVFDAPVNDMIMGASVSGQSRTLNQLRLRLIPDDKRIRVGIEAHGVVHSNTGASSGPVTIYNRGETRYVGRKLVLVSPSGLHVWPAVAEAHAASNTEGIDTGYESVPLVRSIIRNMAQTQQDEAYGQAMAQVEARVEETVRNRLDKEANPRINKLSDEYVKMLQGPLERLELSPTPISLSTTEDRAIVRFRVAGDNQLGAHTPRPCAPSDSVASVQVHESVLNNAADHLGLNGQTFTLPELYHTVADQLGTALEQPDDLPEDAQVTFADQDAVLIRCDDGKIWVTLSIAELSQGRRSFKNFKATAAYHLVSRGLHTEMERDGVVRLAGSRLNLGEQIALRGVISKIFSQNRRPQVIPEEQAADTRFTGLRVSQLVVVDGWIGLAVAPDHLARGKSKAGTSVNR